MGHDILGNSRIADFLFASRCGLEDVAFSVLVPILIGRFVRGIACAGGIVLAAECGGYFIKVCIMQYQFI